MWNDALALSMVMILASLSIISILFSLARKERAFWIFSAGYICGTISFILFPAQGRMSPWVGIIAANIVLMMFHFCMAFGIRTFYGYARPWPLRFWIYLSAFVIIFIILTFSFPEFRFRAVAFSLFVILLTIEFIKALIPGVGEFPKIIRSSIVCFISSAILLHTIRIVLLLIPGNHVSLFMNVNPITTFTFIISIFISVVWSGSLIMIDDIRLMNDMRIKNKLLENLAMKDELTGVYNRHYLDQTLHAEMERQDRYNMPLSLIMIDVDHFKSINDNFGHDVGDIVLTEIARRISEGIRETDVLFRWGGEEFLILMPHTEISGAALLAEKLRMIVSSVPITPVDIVTASFGVAERKKDEQRNGVFRRIDQALYRAKNGGRNRVEIQTEYISTSGTVRLEWNKEWESGNAKIDDAHRTLVRMGNELFNLSITQGSSPLLLEKINGLIDHLRTHFSEEDDILSESGYPGTEEHARIHKNLLHEAMTFREKFIAGECESSLIFNFIVNRIIVDHLLSTDILFFPYLKKE